MKLAVEVLYASKGEKEFVMVATMRRTFVLVIMALVMLAGLFGWTIHVERSAPFHNSSSMHVTQMRAAGPNYTCPPPPFNCQV